MKVLLTATFSNASKATVDGQQTLNLTIRVGSTLTRRTTLLQLCLWVIAMYYHEQRKSKGNASPAKKENICC